MKKYRSRKFGLATFSLIFSAVGLGQGWIDGGTWVAAMALVLGLYGAGNIAGKYYDRQEHYQD